jgi:hypothetical protein
MRVGYSPITHNPWHPDYPLTVEGRHRVQREIAPHLLADAKAEYPGQTVSIVFGDEAYAGFVSLT